MWAHRSASGTLSAILVAALVVGAVLATVAAGAGVATGETGEAGRNGDLNTTNVTNDTTNTTTETLDGTADTTDDTLDSTNGTTGDGTTDNVTNVTDDSGGLTDTLLSTTDDVADATLDADTALEVDGDGLDAALDADASLDGDSSTSASGDLNGSAAGSGDDRGATAAAAGGSFGFDDTPDLPLPSVGGAALGVGVTALAVRRVLQSAGGSSAGGSSGGWLRTLRATERFVLLEPDSWRGRWWRFLGLLGYQRSDDSDPLAHDGRARIHRCVTTCEGAYLSEIARTTGIPLSTVRYHLRILEHEGLVTDTKVLGKRWYVPVGADRPERDLALDDGPVRTVLETLADGGPGSVSDLAERVDRDPSTVTHHLSRLEDAGLVERERDGAAVVNRLAPEVQLALAEEGSTAAADRPETEVERGDTDVERTGWAASHAALR